MIAARTWGCLAVGALIQLVAAASCTVNRVTDKLECATVADCTGSGIFMCEQGYCIVQSCPADCTSCDEALKTCEVTCDATHSCSAPLTCPTGWDCTFTCSTASACPSISCASGSTCSVTCGASGACGTIDCSNACKCDVTCPGGSGECGTDSCPKHGNGANAVHCTTDGSTGSPCSSTAESGCTNNC